jgi:hypothetical protein
MPRHLQARETLLGVGERPREKGEAHLPVKSEYCHWD